MHRMKLTRSSPVARPAALAASILLWAPYAVAQMPPGMPQTGGPMPDLAGPAPPKAKVVPPPALPGAASTASRPAPATRPATDMEPTDALFDAINRGDIAAARDAISRGADMKGRNILGMTPMELAVDLGRNDICFLLLSFRGEANPSSRQSAATAEKPPAKPVRQVAQKSARPVSTPPAQPQTPRLFANDGGTPIPNAGFLGFDASRR